MVSLISSKKLTKTHCILVETNSFVHFLEEFAAWQFAFEIVWPLTNKTNYNLLKKSWIFYSCIFEKILHEHKITIQLIIGFVPIVYKSNLEAQNHVLEIIYTLHPKLQGTPMTKKKNINIFVWSKTQPHQFRIQSHLWNSDQKSKLILKRYICIPRV